MHDFGFVQVHLTLEFSLSLSLWRVEEEVLKRKSKVRRRRCDTTEINHTTKACGAHTMPDATCRAILVRVRLHNNLRTTQHNNTTTQQHNNNTHTYTHTHTHTHTHTFASGRKLSRINSRPHEVNRGRKGKQRNVFDDSFRMCQNAIATQKLRVRILTS